MIAHMRKSDYKEQTVQEHLESVSAIAKEFGKKVNVQSMAELAGYLHDMGKNTKAFSTYIENAVKKLGAPSVKIDHSSAGAKYLYEKYYIDSPEKLSESISNIVIEMVGMVILSHHSGLQNFLETDGSQSDFFRRVCREDLPYYEEVCTTFLSVPGNQARVEELYQASLKEMKTFLLQHQQLSKQWQGKSHISRFVYYSILMKYIFSCLIDADRTDSRRFDEDDPSELYPSNQLFFKESYDHLIDQLQEWAAGPDASHPINELRAAMSEQCDLLADEPSSIYQLSIPTGGGKTFASLRYALKHAHLEAKDRIIYVVPYTTILEQNADAVRKIIKNKDMVLEHHANVIDDAESDDEPDFYQQNSQKQMQLARDNWDHPIIFTTMVQFLDTFYGKGTRKARRLHNLTNAIVIFDEVQSVPIKHISLFNSAVNFLHYFGKSSIILCTATQPSLTATAYPLLMNADAEMVKDLPDVVKAFQRVSIKSKVTTQGWNANEISNFALDELEDKQSLLIILNTKKAVLNVYHELKESSGYSVYHLSTSMCPQHRKDILKEVKKKLKPGDEKVICVSTQLIEAGVDISFECVIRSLAGLDSIAQAAGRCNRNGEYAKGTVYIIRAQDEELSRLPEIVLGQRVTEEDVLTRSELAEDLLSPAAIQTYFDFYLTKAAREIRMSDSKLNIPLIELIDHSQKYYEAVPQGSPRTLVRSMYKTLESHFEVIEAPTTGVLVPYNDEGRKLIADLNEEIRDYDQLNLLLKKAQLYSVNVYSHTLRQLDKEKLIYPLRTEGIYALQDSGYHKEFGLSLEGEGEWSQTNF
ncbi:MAG TPA: CRISPR-associated helicase Cas3' [Paenibacillus sp.]|jgi:CRISPR-associated endonuclease/helicase Cas3